jgi:KaiC/GvpD/RAD55 family RecA-like ATPase
MLIEHLIYNFILSFPAVFGILTIFGKKKTGNAKPPEQLQPVASIEPITQDNSSTSSPIPENTTTVPTQFQPSPYPAPVPTEQASAYRSSTVSGQVPVYKSEETSLTKLLQSLLQDLPSVSPSSSTSNLDMPASPEYVPIRATPQSRPMVIDPKGRPWKGSTESDDDKSDVDSVSQTSSFRGENMISSPSRQPPASPPITKVKETTGPIEKPGKPEKPDKLDKIQVVQKTSPSTPLRKPTMGRQEFNYIFSLTQGSLETQGLVILNGAAGSGKTTICASLAGNYEKIGNPCIYVTYDQSPSSLRDQMKKLGTDPSQYESDYRFILVDGYSSQSESFSMEPYYVEQPFDLQSVQDVITRNGQIFSGEKLRVLIDSLDKIIGKGSSKEFGNKFVEFIGKIKELGATIIVTIDLTKLAKDACSIIENAADCIIDILQSDDGKSRDLKIRKSNGAMSKADSETVQLESGKGLVFV